ncbi:MAG: CmpA/NrtA family ABC transporter substrate-binding protein [Burkholderiales bacterium]
MDQHTQHIAGEAGTGAEEPGEVLASGAILTQSESDRIHSAQRRRFITHTGMLTASALMGLVPPGVRQGAWAAVRDKLISGENDASHVLYGLVYGVQLGIGGPKKDMAVLCTINHNGQAITLSNALKAKGATDGASLKKLVGEEKREYTFAQTFPTGTHAMWLYYWLAAHGINPVSDVKTITVPPPQMVANMRVGNMDGYCVGEPWNARAIYDNIGFTVAKQVNQIALYKQAADQAKVPVPKDAMRSSKLTDGVLWDGTDPARYASAFKVKAA